jgi:hypothetical protein
MCLELHVTLQSKVLLCLPVALETPEVSRLVHFLWLCFFDLEMTLVW